VCPTQSSPGQCRLGREPLASRDAGRGQPIRGRRPRAWGGRAPGRSLRARGCWRSQGRPRPDRSRHGRRCRCAALGHRQGWSHQANLPIHRYTVSKQQFRPTSGRAPKSDDSDGPQCWIKGVVSLNNDRSRNEGFESALAIIRYLDDLASYNVEFRGQPHDQRGNPIDWSVFRPSFNTILQAVKPPDVDECGRPTGREPPPVVVHISGRPYAQTFTGSRSRMDISLGLVFAAGSLPCTLSVIHDFAYRSSPGVPIDELRTFRPSKEVMVEVGALLEAWRESEKHEWRIAVLPKPFTIVEPGHRSVSHKDGILRMIGLHERGHWELANNTSEAELSETLELTRQHVRNCATTTAYPHVRKLCRWALSRRRVRENWLHELTADLIAVHTLLNRGASRWSPEVRLGDLTDIASYFFVLKLSQFFWQFVLRKRPAWISHPPPEVRELVCIHGLAHSTGRTFRDFLTTSWGPGVMADRVAESIQDEYLLDNGLTGAPSRLHRKIRNPFG